MSRSIFAAFLIAGLLLQGLVAAAVDVLPEDAASSHCAGSEPAPATGDCCDGAMSAGCAVHCQAAEAPSAFVLPARDVKPTFRLPADERANPSPDYAPDLRPPIA